MLIVGSPAQLAKKYSRKITTPYQNSNIIRKSIQYASEDINTQQNSLENLMVTIKGKKMNFGFQASKRSTLKECFLFIKA